VLEKISIIYENEDVLAINKPAGLMVHNNGKNTDSTLYD
jgi:23S rRNA-/tRNA-specific pseudouridylate synthase